MESISRDTAASTLRLSKVSRESDTPSVASASRIAGDSASSGRLVPTVTVLAWWRIVSIGREVSSNVWRTAPSGFRRDLARRCGVFGAAEIAAELGQHGEVACAEAGIERARRALVDEGVELFQQRLAVGLLVAHRDMAEIGENGFQQLGGAVDGARGVEAEHVAGHGRQHEGEIAADLRQRDHPLGIFGEGLARPRLRSRTRSAGRYAP
jgi:hypothetical protein